MGREKRNLPAAVAGGPKERHRRAQRSQYDPTAPVPAGFVAKPALPKTTKHHSYFEFVENKDKKKKLEFQITTKKTPPPGFEFVPAGNPELTAACKELSREKDAMIFIVSVWDTDWSLSTLVTNLAASKNAKDTSTSNILAHQVHRVGHHVRQIIVEEARASLGQILDHVLPKVGGAPEPIPESQQEYDAQVDAALRDLFPRIPNTDRQMIIEHAFRRDPTHKGEKKVGLSEDITLARRVQLAVLAHIRHTHTRYDTLLKETTWQNARKVVETLCLDTLVKWRGDEESGRDQLDEILREVVVISDSEGEESGEETEDSSVDEVVYQSTNPIPSRPVQNISSQVGTGQRQSPMLNSGARTPVTPKPKGKVKKAKRKTSTQKKGQRGFKRYQAAWQDALDRHRNEQDPVPQTPVVPTPNYMHDPPPARAVVHMGEELPAASQLRLVSGRAGPMPYENGYVGKPHHPTSVQFISGPQVARKVKSPLYEAPPTTHPPNHLQDMLVQSIEPASPDTMKPSFVRTVPPRGQAYRNEPPISSSIQRPAIMSSPSRGIDVRGEPMQISRSAASQHLAYGDRPYEFTGQGPPSPHHGSGIPNAPSHRYDTRSRGTQNPARILVSRRPYEEVQRLGDRDTPIVMEDRGGFYERVPVRSTGDYPALRDERIANYGGPVPEPYRAPEMHQTIPWQEGWGLPQGIRSNADVETIPISRAALESRPRPILAEPRAVPYPVSGPAGAHDDPRRYIEREPRLVRYNPPAPEVRPVVNEPMAARYEPYREM
ncbi:hypothetical protein NW762_007020 [Fusarium torreyae]|uniref:DUF2293 domain-containing protein n=1 Tax=Fusarium torreyae TaxID=1237075 RepID=A0A9W8VH30_9HYPO|nr:hypothetical protein NW762_007020 [Fusarium torreyae]